jgi:hypothetical protein
MQRVIRPEAGEDHQVFDRIRQNSATSDWFIKTGRRRMLRAIRLAAGEGPRPSPELISVRRPPTGLSKPGGGEELIRVLRLNASAFFDLLHPERIKRKEF